MDTNTNKKALGANVVPFCYDCLMPMLKMFRQNKPTFLVIVISQFYFQQEKELYNLSCGQNASLGK